jgi:hypothetical protein
MEELPKDREVITRAQKIKIAAGIGVAATGAGIELSGSFGQNYYGLFGGYLALVGGALYALRHAPEPGNNHTSDEE